MSVMSNRLALAALACLIAAPAGAQLIQRKDLSYAMAKTIAENALADCKARGYAVSVVVVDRGGDTIVALRADDEPNDDDLFGPAHPVRVGESWPVNAPLFARTGALSAAFDPRDVSGTVTLAAVKPAGGVPCLEVRWKLDARHGAFKPGSLPAGLIGVMTSTSVAGSTLLPIDAKLPAVSRETAIAGVGDFTGSSSDGSTYSVHHELRQVIHVDLSPLR